MQEAKAQLKHAVLERAACMGLAAAKASAQQDLQSSPPPASAASGLPASAAAAAEGSPMKMDADASAPAQTHVSTGHVIALLRTLAFGMLVALLVISNMHIFQQMLGIGRISFAEVCAIRSAFSLQQQNPRACMFLVLFVYTSSGACMKWKPCCRHR